MSLIRLLAVFLCFLMVVSCGNDDDDSDELSLADFVFEVQQLPEGCILASLKSDEDTPCGVQSNPLVSSERQFLDCFAGELLHDEILVADVHSGLFSVYVGKDEIGVFGLEFSSPILASQGASLLRKENSEPQRFAVFQKERIVILLWRDDESDACFDRFKELITERME